MAEAVIREGVAPWLAERRACSGLVVRQIPLAECAHWSLVDGVLRHSTGRFFSVAGIQCHGGPSHLDGLTLPMIHQPEIGILGFVVRRGASGWEWLLQAKTEPGNVHGTQIGPSVQATLSNYLRVHGGHPTEMIELFTQQAGAARCITDVEQSEQGDRFLGKYHRNMVVEVEPGFQGPVHRTWCWFGAEAVRRALAEEFVFNTDARSVLCCTDWSLLCDPGDAAPFERWHAADEGFGAQLLASHRVPVHACGLAAALGMLEDVRRHALSLRAERVPLQQLRGWKINDWAIECESPDTDPVVRTFSIQSEDREVREWCQPLLTNRNEGRAVLACTRLNGALRFFIPPRVEPGFAERAQFGPSLLTGLGHANSPVLEQALADSRAAVHLSVKQSDEGGRFKDSIALYEIIEIPPEAGPLLEGEGAWVSLSALHHMAASRGLLSNELRSCISLLLHWA